MKRVLILIAALVVASCGDSSPAAPTAPAITFTGVYSGTYLVATCNASPPAFSPICAGTGFAPGARFPMSLSLGQNGTSVSGNLTLGSISGNFQGTATGSGLQGTAVMNPIVVAGSSALVNVTTWSSTLTANNLSGSFNVAITVPSVSATAQIAATFTQLTR